LSDKLSFCVVIAMYNEAGVAKKCIETIQEFLSKIKGRTGLVIVDDGSIDDTNAIVRASTQDLVNVFFEEHKNNQGYGAANVTGGKRALKEKFKYALFMDADLTQDPKYINQFIDYMKKDIDYIKATRYAKGGNVLGVSYKRRIVSKIGNMVAKVLLNLPLTDYTNGFRAIKCTLLSQIQAEERGFAYLIEEVNKVSKIAKSYAEVPYTLQVRDSEISVSKFTYSPQVYFTYMKWLFKK
jgi:dolichol-phosphate mannosyltransferase